jgi:hypothetical protein
MSIPEAGRTYRLQNRATGFALWGRALPELADSVRGDDPGGLLAREQRWRLEATDFGCHRLIHEDSGRVLDSNAERQVYIMNSNNGSFQKWLIRDEAEGYFRLQNLATSYMLDNNADRDVYTMRSNNGAFQRWRFIPV